MDSATAILCSLGQELSGNDPGPLGLCASSEYAGEMLLLFLLLLIFIAIIILLLFLYTYRILIIYYHIYCAFIF